MSASQIPWVTTTWIEVGICERKAECSRAVRRRGKSLRKPTYERKGQRRKEGQLRSSSLSAFRRGRGCSRNSSCSNTHTLVIAPPGGDRTWDGTTEREGKEVQQMSKEGAEHDGELESLSLMAGRGNPRSESPDGARR